MGPLGEAPPFFFPRACELQLIKRDNRRFSCRVTRYVRKSRFVFLFFFFWITAIAEIRLWIVSFVLLFISELSINLLHFERDGNLMANFQNDEFKILLVDFA